MSYIGSYSLNPPNPPPPPPGPPPPPPEIKFCSTAKGKGYLLSVRSNKRVARTGYPLLPSSPPSVTYPCNISLPVWSTQRDTHLEECTLLCCFSLENPGTRHNLLHPPRHPNILSFILIQTFEYHGTYPVHKPPGLLFANIC